MNVKKSLQLFFVIAFCLALLPGSVKAQTGLEIENVELWKELTPAPGQTSYDFTEEPTETVKTVPEEWWLRLGVRNHDLDLGTWPPGTWAKAKTYIDNELVSEFVFTASMGKISYGWPEGPISMPDPGLYDFRVDIYRGDWAGWSIVYTHLDDTFAFSLLVMELKMSYSQRPCRLVRGETGDNLTIYVSNDGNDTLYDPRLVMSSAGGLDFEENDIPLDNIGPGENIPVTLEVSAPENADIGTTYVTFVLFYDDYAGKPNLDGIGAYVKVINAPPAHGIIYELGGWWPWWLLYFLISALLAAWVYRDSKDRRMRRKNWTGLTFLTSAVGLATYLKRRRPRRKRE